MVSWCAQVEVFGKTLEEVVAEVGGRSRTIMLLHECLTQHFSDCEAESLAPGSRGNYGAAGPTAKRMLLKVAAPQD